MPKTPIYCANNWTSYKDYKPITDRYVIAIKTNNNGYIYELKYTLYSEIEEDCPNIQWIDTPKTIASFNIDDN